jgi:hypothetical protein
MNWLLDSLNSLPESAGESLIGSSILAVGLVWGGLYIFVFLVRAFVRGLELLARLSRSR